MKRLVAFITFLCSSMISFTAVDALNIGLEALHADGEPGNSEPARRNQPASHEERAHRDPNIMSEAVFSMEDGRTLISSDRRFALGFFTHGRWTDTYIGVWFRTPTASDDNFRLLEMMVWVGNRGSPLLGEGLLTLSRRGQLAISDDLGSVAYITAELGVSNASLCLLNNGNLVVRSEPGNKTVWESFHDSAGYRFSAILPGLRYRGGLSSADGSFSLQLDGDELVIWKGDVVYWMSGTWGGRSFSGIPEMESNPLYEYSFGGQGFNFSVTNSSIFSKIVLSNTGKLQQWTWLEEALEWQPVWSVPSDNCHVPGYCGPQSICDASRSPPCHCFPGHRPAFQRGWRHGNFSGGCARKKMLHCRNGTSDNFVVMPNARFNPSLTLTIPGLQHVNGCELACLRRCSCTAFYLESESSICKIFEGNIFDVEKLPISYVGREIHIRYPRELTNKWRKMLWEICLPMTVLVAILFSIFLCYLQRRRRLSHTKGCNKTGKSEPEDLTYEGLLLTFANVLKVEETSMRLQLLSFEVVAEATDHFSEENKLGQGGFGPVYKGKLTEGRDIAVKRLLDNSEQGLEEFKNELALVPYLQHVNLMGPSGCCTEGEEKILVYDFMPNKSLDKILFDESKRSSLDWGKRVHIIEGIAQGLLYLHKYSRLRIVHRDIKASNILLDAEMNPMITDFGTARILKQGIHYKDTKRIVGTLGYMSPEYAVWGHFSEKSDVFSFGVLLLEIVSGRMNGSTDHSEQFDLFKHVWERWESDRVLEVVDSSLGDLGDLATTEEVKRCIHVGLLCVQESAIHRPTMSHVVSMLNNSGSFALLPPQQPPMQYHLR